MFGHDDNQQQPAQDSNSAAPSPLNGALGDDNSPPAHADPASGPAPSAPTMSAPHVVQTNFSAPDADSNADAPAPDSAAQSAAPAPAAAGGEDLLHLKQQALQHLSPLVGQLDQTPEEKFRTTMMMIQASDDKSLVKTAFEAAQAITDDKARAQALLDIINEINYFTQHQSQS